MRSADNRWCGDQCSNRTVHRHRVRGASHRLRRSRSPDVVQAMVRLVDEALRSDERFGLAEGLASADVTVADPATGSSNAAASASPSTVARAGATSTPPSPSSMRAAVTTPAEPVGARVVLFPTDCSLPRYSGGSASALPVSRPAQRSLALRPAWSLSHPRRPVSSKCFKRCRYLHHPLRLLPAGTTLAGRDSHPLRDGAFPRRTE